MQAPDAMNKGLPVRWMMHPVITCQRHVARTSLTVTTGPCLDERAGLLNHVPMRRDVQRRQSVDSFTRCPLTATRMVSLIAWTMPASTGSALNPATVSGSWNHRTGPRLSSATGLEEGEGDDGRE